MIERALSVKIPCYIVCCTAVFSVVTQRSCYTAEMFFFSSLFPSGISAIGYLEVTLYPHLKAFPIKIHINSNNFFFLMLMEIRKYNEDE